MLIKLIYADIFLIPFLKRGGYQAQMGKFLKIISVFISLISVYQRLKTRKFFNLLFYF